MTDSPAVPPLRFGLFLDGETVNGWQAAVVDHLLTSGDAELCLLVVGPAGRAGGRLRRSRAMRRGSVSEKAGALAFSVFTRTLSRPRALRPAASPWPPETPVIRVSPARAKPSGIALTADDVAAISTHDLDVLIRFGPTGLTGGVLDAARHGVWGFDHDDGLGSAGFREIVDREPAVHVTLRRLTDDPEGGTILREGWFATAPASYAKTRDRILFGAAAWPARVCRALRLAGASIDDGLVASAARAVDDSPDIGAFVRFLRTSMRARLDGLWHHGMRHDDWNIGVVEVPVATVLRDQSIPAVRWAPERRGHYTADPFGVSRGGAVDVYYEDYSHAEGKASIARRQWTHDQGWATPETVLDIGSHLSYPLVFEHEGRRLMLPESRASGRLVLYEADADGRWQPVSDLDLGEDVADSTIVEHDGRWWLFAVRGDRLNPATDLYLCSADRPDGPWQAHPRNPVVVDVRAARPGGPLFRVDGQLFRPAQDCSTGYGDRLAIKRIVTLTTARFEEADEFVLEPEPDGPYSFGLHTLTGVGDVTLVDGRRWVRDTRATVRAVRRRLPI